MKHVALAVAAVLAPGLALAQPTPTTEPVTTEAPAEDPPLGEVTATAALPAAPVEEPPAPADDKTVSVTYDKGLTFETADDAYELKLGLRSQFRIEAVARPTSTRPSSQSSFLLPRLRLQLEGHAYGEANRYKVEFDMANKGYALLKDAWVDHAFAQGPRVRAGQWKKPFNRQEMVSDFGSEFLERSLMPTSSSGAGRDLGVALHNNYEKSPEGLEWAIGIFNATSDKPASARPPACPARCRPIRRCAPSGADQRAGRFRPGAGRARRLEQRRHQGLQRG
jgi:hypothetical protein